MDPEYDIHITYCWQQMLESWEGGGFSDGCRLAGSALRWSGNLANESVCQPITVTWCTDRVGWCIHLRIYAQVQTVELLNTNQVLGRTHAALAHAMLDGGRAHDAAAHSREAVACVRSAYGERSEVAKQEERKWRSLGVPL